jgi:hypothetical protein
MKVSRVVFQFGANKVGKRGVLKDKDERTLRHIKQSRILRGLRARRLFREPGFVR